MPVFDHGNYFHALMSWNTNTNYLNFTTVRSFQTINRIILLCVLLVPANQYAVISSSANFTNFSETKIRACASLHNSDIYLRGHPPQICIKILIFFQFFFNILKDTSFYNSNPKFHFIPIAVSCLKSLVCKTTSMR